MNSDKSTINKLLGSGNLTEALEAIELRPPSPWRDTKKLRCLRALHKERELVEFSVRLFDSLQQEALPYPINEFELNRMRRHLAIGFSEYGKPQLACSIMQDLVSAKPQLATLRREYAFALAGVSRFAEAEEHLRTALRLEPSYARSYAQLAKLCFRNGRTEEGLRCTMRAASLEPDDLEYLQRMVYWTTYSSKYSAQHGFQLARLWAARSPLLSDSPVTLKPTVDADKPLKIAFVSGDFYAHPISFHLLPLLQNLNRSDFHISLYSDHKKPDKVTKELRSTCDKWVDSGTLSDQALIDAIGQDKINILVDLNGHGPDNRSLVFANQKSAIQVSWLGYPASTGLDRDAYRITDRVADPIGINDTVYSEKLVRLPNCISSFQPHAKAPKVIINSEENLVRFGSFCGLSKISSLVLDAWAAAMRKVPNSTIYLKRKELGDPSSRQHLLARLANRGIVKERVIFAPSKPTIEEHLAEYSKIDIAFDTFPFNSPTTALEALWMGVPVITLVNEDKACRRTASILNCLDLQDLVCDSIDQFAIQSSTLSNDRPALETLKSGLREQMAGSALLDHKQFAFDFGYEMKKVWRTRIDSQNTSSTTSVSGS